MAGGPKLVRGALKRNHTYSRNGLKSYAYALQKWNIGPTVDGPYCTVNQVQEQGSQAIMRKFGARM